MFHLLLDEHVSPIIGRGVSQRVPTCTVSSVQAIDGGKWEGSPDEEILLMARLDQMVLVTFDQKSILPLLGVWGESGISHGGVIFIDEKTFAPNDFGGLIRALADLALRFGEDDWTDCSRYLVRVR